MKNGYMWGIPYPPIGEAWASFGVFGSPPHSIIQKSFWLRTALKSFDFCKLFLYYFFIIVSYTIAIDYAKVVVSLG